MTQKFHSKVCIKSTENISPWRNLSRNAQRSISDRHKAEIIPTAIIWWMDLIKHATAITMDYYSAIRRSEALVNPENIMLGKRSQTRKAIPRMIPLTCKVQKRQVYKDRKWLPRTVLPTENEWLLMSTEFLLEIVFISCSCCHKFPQMYWPKMTHTYSSPGGQSSNGSYKAKNQCSF